MLKALLLMPHNLNSLNYLQNTPKVLEMIQSSSLVVADIQVGWSGMREEVLDDYFDAAAQLLRQQLENSLKSFSIKLGTFHNLICLELRGSVLGTGVFPLMLKSSPKLKVIILHEMYTLNSTCVRALGEDVLCMWYVTLP